MQLNANFAPNFKILLGFAPEDQEKDDSAAIWVAESPFRNHEVKAVVVAAASKFHQLLTTTRALEEHGMFFRKPQDLEVAFEKIESVPAIFPEGSRKF